MFKTFSLFLLAALPYLTALPIYAEAQKTIGGLEQNTNAYKFHQNQANLVPAAYKLKTPSTVRELLSQSQPIKITGVTLNSAGNGLEITTDRPAINPVTRTQGKVSYTDIPNAVLADGKEFQFENPAKGIASISVTQVSPTFVRVLITGTDAVPNAQLVTNEKGLVITSIPALTMAQVDEDEEDIVVSGDRQRRPSVASKTDTPLRDIPASVQVIPQEIIKDTGATTLDRAIKASPSVQQSSQSNYGFANTYTIRGLTQSFLRDGTPDGLSQNGYFRTLTDVDSIEILKGPGSSLFGSLSPGGSINLVSKQPQFTPSYAANLIFGGLGTYGGNLDFTGKLTEDGSLLYRFNGNYQKIDGFRGLSNKIIEILPKITWKPNESNTIKFSFDYRQIDLVADTFGIPFRGTELLNVPTETRYYTPFANTKQPIYRGAINHEWQANADLAIRNNLVVLYRDLFIGRNASGGLFVGFTDVLNDRILREQTDNAFDLTYQTEAVWKVLTGSLKHTILAGLEYQYKNYTSVRDTLVFNPIRDPFNPILEQSREERRSQLRNYDVRLQANYLGIYLQDQIEFSEQFKARFGARFDSFGLKRNGFANTLNTANTAIISTQVGELNQSPSRFSYQAGLVYQPIRELSLYGGVSKNNLAILSTEGISSELDPPESALQYEIGVKSELFNGKLGINLAFFDVTREDFVVVINNIRQAVGSQKTRGIELEFNAKPVDGWNLFGGVVFYDAKLINLPSNRAFEGNRPNGVPNAAASLWSTYEFQTGGLKGFGFGGGLTYRDNIFQDQDNRRVIPAYTTLDLVLFYRQKTFEAQLNFTNVTNVAYFRNGVNTGALPGDPFTVTATLGFKF